MRQPAAIIGACVIALSAADANAGDPAGDSALHNAVRRHLRLREVKELIDLGANVNARNANGETPLFTALWQNCVSEDDLCAAVSTLVTHGATNMASDVGFTPMDAAVIWDHGKSLEALVAAGWDDPRDLLDDIERPEVDAFVEDGCVVLVAADGSERARSVGIERLGHARIDGNRVWFSTTEEKSGSLRYGLMDSQCRVITQARYGRVQDFREGLAAVRAEKGWGYIRKDGTHAMEPRFHSAGSFCEGAAWVGERPKGGQLRYHLISRDGTVLFTAPQVTGIGGGQAGSVRCEGGRPAVAPHQPAGQDGGDGTRVPPRAADVGGTLPRHQRLGMRGSGR